MKILLSYLSDSNDTREYSISIIPSGLFPLAVYLEKNGHEVRVANFSHMGYKKALTKIGEIAPDIASFSILTHNRNDTLKLIREIKSKYPEITIVAGGPHASALSGEFARRFTEIDHVVEGDGESGFEILLSKDGGSFRPPRIIRTEKMTDGSESGSFMDFKGELIGVNVNEQFKFITPTRGTTLKDPFSSVRSTWKRNSTRSASLVAEDMKRANEEYGILFFNLIDEGTGCTRDYLLELCGKIRELGFYPMWSCQMHPADVDETTVTEMKSAGCERIFVRAGSGSDRVLEYLNPGTTVQDIERACSIVRNAGLYLSLIFRTGLFDEKHSDVARSAALVKRTLPGDGIVFPAVYYPGSDVYSRAVESGKLEPDAMFDSKDRGLYIRSDPHVQSWIEELRTSIRMIRPKSWYREKEFKAHRKAAPECWVTDMLEGDYYFDEDRERLAEQCYMNVVSALPANPWGHLRLGKLAFSSARFESAAHYYTRVTELVPKYYGGWLKLAESLIAQGSRREGRDAAGAALTLNRWDPRIQNLVANV